MKRDFAIETIRQHRADLNALGVTRLDLFGSIARDEANETSDVDVAADFNADGLQGMAFIARWEEIRLMLKALLCAEVDVVPYPLRDNSPMHTTIGRDAVAVF